MANVLSIAGPKSKYKEIGSPPAGFLAGIWHGVICPFTFLYSLLDDDVRMYEAHNNGRLYECGFLIGAVAALGGGGSQAG
jgi:hypothetical protein